MLGTKITLCIHRSTMGNIVNEVSSLAVIFSIKVYLSNIENFTLILKSSFSNSLTSVLDIIFNY